MKCPHCEYEPSENEYGYCDSPGRFYKHPVKADREKTDEWYSKNDEREAVYGCPKCGIMFMDFGYSGDLI